VRESDAAALAPRVRAMQAALATRHGVAAAQAPPRPAEGLQTWMEVYPQAADDFAGELEAAAARAGLGALLAGPRRAEVFTDLSLPCA
jgi:hypothetical protein